MIETDNMIKEEHVTLTEHANKLLEKVYTSGAKIQYTKIELYDWKQGFESSQNISGIEINEDFLYNSCIVKKTFYDFHDNYLVRTIKKTGVQFLIKIPLTRENTFSLLVLWAKIKDIDQKNTKNVDNLLIIERPFIIGFPSYRLMFNQNNSSISNQSKYDDFKLIPYFNCMVEFNCYPGSGITFNTERIENKEQIEEDDYYSIIEKREQVQKKVEVITNLNKEYLESYKRISLRIKNISSMYWKSLVGTLVFVDKEDQYIPNWLLLCDGSYIRYGNDELKRKLGGVSRLPNLVNHFLKSSRSAGDSRKPSIKDHNHSYSGVTGSIKNSNLTNYGYRYYFPYYYSRPSIRYCNDTYGSIYGYHLYNNVSLRENMYSQHNHSYTATFSSYGSGEPKPAHIKVKVYIVGDKIQECF